MSVYTGINSDKYILASEPFVINAGDDIYEIHGLPSLVAKKYHRHRRTAVLEQKILTMLNMKLSPENKVQFNWPQDILYEDGRFSGFIMHRTDSVKVLSEVLVDLTVRGVTWDSYIQIAVNLSATIHGLHENGIIFGNLSPDNIYLDSTGIISVADSVSFHICDSTNNQVYRCEGGDPLYLPRELQGVDSACESLPTFTEASDCFALAVIIYKLLMNGSHPFGSGESNTYVSASILNTAKNIEAGFLPYFDAPSEIPILSNTLSYDILSKELKGLFRRVFIDGHVNPEKRPRPFEWYQELCLLQKSLKECMVDRNHYYYSKLTACPWCVLSEELLNPAAQGNGKNDQTDATNTMKNFKYYADPWDSILSLLLFIDRPPSSKLR